MKALNIQNKKLKSPPAPLKCCITPQGGQESPVGKFYTQMLKNAIAKVLSKNHTFRGKSPSAPISFKKFLDKLPNHSSTFFSLNFRNYAGMGETPQIKSCISVISLIQEPFMLKQIKIEAMCFRFNFERIYFKKYFCFSPFVETKFQL